MQEPDLCDAPTSTFIHCLMLSAPAPPCDFTHPSFYECWPLPRMSI